MDPKTGNGWLLCPSKSFPGYFYYFNIATGETKWCRNENERKISPVQRIDHGYPEPSSAPFEEAPGNIYPQTAPYPYPEGPISNYPQHPQNMYQITPNNFSTVVVNPFDQTSQSMPCQVQLPMVWPSGNSPQIIMFVMNQAMRQMTIDDPRAFRQPQHQLMPSRSWNQPNYIFAPNRTWNEPSQSWPEPNQSRSHPNQVFLKPNEPNRQMVVNSGKTHFVNSREPFEGRIVRPNNYDPRIKNQHDLNTNRTLNLNKPLDVPGPSNLNKIQQNMNHSGDKRLFSTSYANIAKENSEKQSNHAVIKQSNYSFGKSNFANSTQNVSKPNQGLFGQNQTKEGLFSQRKIFGQRQTNQLFGQSQTKKELFGPSQTKQLFGQSQINKEPFGQSQTKMELFGPSQTKQLLNQNQINKEHFGQSQTEQIFGQSQTKKELFGPSQTKQHLGQSQTIQPSQNCPKTFQTTSRQIQKPTEKSTLIQRPKVDFLISPQSEEVNFDANATENSTLAMENTDEITPEAEHADLDENDLRRILMERKRKHKILETTGTIKTKKIKTSMKDIITAVPVKKKKVTFNLDCERFSDSANGDDTYNNIEVQVLAHSKGESWYAMADPKTLLEEFHVLNTFVQSDPKCTLIIPSGVMSEIDGLSKCRSAERKHVALARRLLRALATPHSHIIVQKSDVSLDISTDDSILNCCLDVMENAFVALVTNDGDLQTKANYLNINCFTIDEIMNSQVERTNPYFDIKKDDKELENVVLPTEKLKTDLPTEKLNTELPAEKIEYLSYGDGNLNWNKKVSNSDRFDFSLDLNGIDAELELNQNANMDVNSELNSGAFEIENNAHSLNSDTTLKIINPNENTYFLTNEKNPVSANRNIDSKSIQSVTQKEPIGDETIASIFKQANDEIKHKSIFEMDNAKAFSKKGSIFEIDPVEKPQETVIAPIFKAVPSNSIFRNIWPATKTQSVSGTGLNKNEPQNPNIIDPNKNSENQLNSNFIREPIRNQKEPSVFGMEIKGNQPKTDSNEIVDLKNKSLKYFLERYYVKNRTIEHLVEERKSEVGCCFKQIMEECLNDTLKNKTNLLNKKYRTPLPLSLYEALQCISIVYDNHTYIQDVVCVIMNIVTKGEVTAKDVIRTVGCGVALIKYLMFITPTTEVVKDADVAMNAVLTNLTLDTDIQPRQSEPALLDDVACVERNKRNFVKDRLEVVKYLKNHFDGWADYDETSEEYTSKPSWRKNNKNTTILRTYGKNLGHLKLHNSKPISMEPDSSQNIDENAKTIKNGPASVNFKNKMLDNIDDKDATENEDFSKEYVNFKLSRVINNNFDAIEKNNDETKQAEPKIVRLFDNIDIAKENNGNKMRETNIFDDISTYGHTFGTTEDNGPKVLRNIKPIKQFEEKYNFDRKHSNLDDIDYSIITKSDENNNFASESTNHNNLSMSLENNGNSNEVLFSDAINDLARNDVKNDCSDAMNDLLNLDSYQNSNATNNESHSMSLEKCITNNTYGTIDIDDSFNSNDITTKYSSNFDFSINGVGYEINDKYDIDAMNDDFKRLGYDVTNDSGYENAIQTYYTMDTFLAKLKDFFMRMHKFLENSVRELRSEDSASTRRIINDKATMSRNFLNKIMKSLKSIIERESSNGTKLKDLVAVAGSIPASDERIYDYKEIVTKCYDHARLVEKAVGAMVTVTD